MEKRVENQSKNLKCDRKNLFLSYLCQRRYRWKHPFIPISLTSGYASVSYTFYTTHCSIFAEMYVYHLFCLVLLFRRSKTNPFLCEKTSHDANRITCDRKAIIRNWNRSLSILTIIVLSPMFIFEAFEPNVALFSTEHSIRWCWDHIFFWAVIVPWVIDWTKTIFLSSSRKNTKILGLLLNWKIFFGILSKKGSFLSWFDFSKNRKINLRFPCCSLTPSERIGGRNCSNKTIFFLQYCYK